MTTPPQLLLLDEPLSNLDAKLRLRLRDDLRRIIKEAGVTALYVTHDQGEAVVLGDRIGVMRSGRLLQMSAPVDLYNSPVDAFVASFTGTTNLIKAVINEGSDPIATTATGDQLSLGRSDGLRALDPVEVAIRPDNLVLRVPDGTQKRSNTFAGSVKRSQFLGDQTRYIVVALGTELEAVEIGTVPRFKVGDLLNIDLPAEFCWAFPAGTMPAAVKETLE